MLSRKMLVLTAICAAMASAGLLNAQTLQVAAVVAQLEGPTVDAAGTVYFTDLNGDRILAMAPDGRVTTYRQPANRPNGMVFDSQFRLIVCERGEAAKKSPSRITRTDMKTGRIEVLTDGYEGKPYVELNDVTVDGTGRIYFTDNPGKAVYRIDTNGKGTRILSAPLIDNANGLTIAPNDRIFYLIEANTGANGSRRIRAFDLSADGTPSNPRVFHNFYPGRSGDGMTIDSEGNLWVAAGLNNLRNNTETLDTKAGIHEFGPDGRLLLHIPVPIDLLTNVAFGGPDLKTLYITAGGTLFKVATKTAGTRR
jgi:gluconolactonase